MIETSLHFHEGIGVSARREEVEGGSIGAGKVAGETRAGAA